jgi:hypothetical protein
MSYLTFKRFITPNVITVVYIIGAIILTIASILMIAGGSFIPMYGMPSELSPYLMPSGVGIAIVGVLLLIFGNLFWRVWCEYLIVQFRIYDALASIDRKTSPPPAVYPPPPAQRPS